MEELPGKRTCSLLCTPSESVCVQRCLPLLLPVLCMIHPTDQGKSTDSETYIGPYVMLSVNL